MSAINVLIVDDSRTVREVIVKTLGMAGVETNEIYQAENGEEGLKVLGQQWVDLVFSDINMPVMNGVEMIERIKADEVLKSIPVVIVTTEGSATRVAELKEKGVSAYIRKPFTPEEVRGVVDEVLGAGHAE